MSVPTIQVHSALTPMTENHAMIHAIERAFRDPSIDTDKIEKLIELRERVRLTQAEGEWNEAMNAAQSDMDPIRKDATNPQTRSKYASFDSLDRALRPIYTQHGFSLSFNTEDGAPDLHVRVVCYVSAKGFTRKYSIDMPADGKGARGNDVMTRTHAVGSATTYGRRYLEALIFNVSFTERDDDGNAAPGPPARGGAYWPTGNIAPPGDYDGGIPNKDIKPKTEPKFSRAEVAKEDWEKKFNFFKDHIRQSINEDEFLRWMNDKKTEINCFPEPYMIKELHDRCKQQLALIRSAALANQVVHDSDEGEPRPATLEDFDPDQLHA